MKMLSRAALLLSAASLCAPSWGQVAIHNTNPPALLNGDRTDLQVDEEGALIISGTITGGGGGTEYTEDAVASVNPVGSMTMCVRRDTPDTGEVSADGDNVAVKCDSKGRIRISVEDTLPVSIAGSVAVTNAGITTIAGAVTSAKVQVDCITGCSGGTAYTEDAAAAADPVGLAVVSRRRDTLSTSEVSADGDNIALLSNNKGQLHVIGTATDALLTTQAGYLDGIEALVTSTNGYVDGLEALVTSTNGYVDGLETLVTSTNTLTTSQNGYVDGLEALVTSTNGYVDGLEALVDGLEDKSDDIVTNTGSTATNVATVAAGIGAPADAAWTSGSGSAIAILKSIDGAVKDTTAVATDITKINSVTPLMGNGVTGTGSQRVTVASDNTPFGVKIDQTTPGTTNLVAAYGFAGTATTTVTRPADTSAYAANDAMSDSTSAPTSGGFTLSSMCRASGGSGILTDLVFLYSTATAVAGNIWIYDAAPTAINDNAAYSVSDADQAKLVTKVPFVTVAGALNAVHNVQNLNLGYTCVGTANLRFLVEVTTGYTPASADALTVRAKFVQTN